MSDLEQKLLAVITESLPQTHVGVLRDYLQKAAQCERKLASVEDELAKERVSIKEQRAAIEALGAKLRAAEEKARNFENQVTELSMRISAAFEAEKRVELALCKNTCESLERERDALFKLSEIVFRNPRQVYQTTTTEDESRHRYENANSGGYYGEQQKSRESASRIVTVKHEAKDE